MAVSAEHKYILISEDVRHCIEVEELSEGTFVLQDAMAKCISLIKEHKDSTLFFLFFVSPGDMQKIHSYFIRLETTSVLYKGIIVSCGKSIMKDFSEYEDVFTLRTTNIMEQEYLFLAAKAFDALEGEIHKKKANEEHNLKLIDAWNDQESLINIGKALSIEKDPDNLLRTILYFSKKITGADAGSIFIVEEADKQKILRFKYSHTFSKNLSYEEFTMPMNTKSIAGYVAVTGQVLNIDDVYNLDEDAPVSFNPSFDMEHGYRTKSMLVLPMRNHIDEIIGVIQLINSKEVGDIHTGNEAFEIRLETDEDFSTKVSPFDDRYESLMEAVAGQAAIALENNRMLIQIENQFEEFVKASVTAIESRDPATSGHSFRVADMCVRTVKAINEADTGPFKDVSYNDVQLKEIEFAALLHDFGKVYIDPSIFLKEKKLFTRDYEYCMMRLNFLYRSLELKYTREGVPPEKIREQLSRITSIMEQVRELNEPKPTDTDPEEVIQKISSFQQMLSADDLHGEMIPVLEQSEIMNLRIRRGSLNPEERKIIESHVEHTYNFVSKIPWPDEYKQIPDIARKHHEKLDGSGYPLGIKDKEQLPIASRIMAIADIFDALNATDRPYKKAMPLEQIFSILREEGASGKLDADLIELFIASKAWEGGEA
jgi:HD-GYP domain-containing protein (c-di-GMP phosphodiesterase class II)